MTAPSIRDAGPADAPRIAEFNQRLAAESEETRLDPQTLLAGVRAVLSDPARGRYFVAERGGEVVGQLMITTEWSDWRNGDLWWLQSVYVHPEHRRQGVFRSLLEHARSVAASDPTVVGLRLYVERENAVARRTYAGLGFREPGYLVMEDVFRRGVERVERSQPN